jgi:hypothetical protein
MKMFEMDKRSSLLWCSDTVKKSFMAPAAAKEFTTNVY